MRWMLLLEPGTNRIVFAFDYVQFHAYHDVLMQVWQLRDATLIEQPYDGQLPIDWHFYRFVDGSPEQLKLKLFEKGLYTFMANELKQLADNRVKHHKAHVKILAAHGLPTTAIAMAKLDLLAELASGYIDGSLSEFERTRFEELISLQGLDDAPPLFVARELVAQRMLSRNIYTSLLQRGFRF